MRKLLLTVAITIIFFGALTVLAVYYTQGNDPLVPQTGTAPAAAIVTQNKVVVSANGLQEDKTPLYLSRIPRARCTDHDCDVAGTEMGSGVTLTAVCFTFGEGMTNMDLRSASARRNPERVSSNLWYGVRHADGSLVFVSEVYLAPQSRKGLNLRLCPVAR